MGITKKMRFEVFKRDAFTCQYCGRKAPDVVLEVDHIKPRAKGGTDDLLNLVTSCKDCNRGKSDRVLSDQQVLRQKRGQLEELQERKEQLAMMFEWQESLLNLESETTDRLAGFWSTCVPSYHLNKHGLESLRKLQRQFDPEEITTAMRIAADQYLDLSEGKATAESVELAWKRVGGICRMRRLQEENPNLQRVFYIRGILRNRLRYVNDRQALELLRHAVALGVDVTGLESHAKEVLTWTEWRTDIENLIEYYESEDKHQ